MNKIPPQLKKQLTRDPSMKRNDKGQFLKTLKPKKCLLCGKMYQPSVYYRKFCSVKCQIEQYKKDRKGKGNPNFKNGFYPKYAKRTLQTTKHMAACIDYRKRFLEKNDYLWCEVCGISNATKYEVHHIYYASRYPKHKELHNRKNLILICVKCHNNFHAGKYQVEFQRLELQRGLKELFN